MQVSEEDLASIEHAKAYQLDDVLLVLLTGTKPTAYYQVSIERGLLDVEPPAFAARLSMDPRIRCTADPAPYEVQQAFRVGAPRDEVIVHHRDGQLTVEVTSVSLPVDTETAAPATARSGAPLLDLGTQPTEAIGYSRNYDLAEAVRDAIDKMPAQGAAIPDWLSTYSVTSIGVEIGGIAGFNHLKVHVSG